MVEQQLEPKRPPSDVNIGPRGIQRAKIMLGSVFRLGSVCKPLRPEENGGNGKHSSIIISPFFITGSNSTKLFYASDQAFYLISMAINLFVKRSAPSLITTASNGCPNTTLAQILTKFGRSVAFVTYDATRSYSGSSNGPTYGTLFHQLFGNTDFMLLSRCQ